MDDVLFDDVDKDDFSTNMEAVTKYLSVVKEAVLQREKEKATTAKKVLDSISDAQDRQKRDYQKAHAPKTPFPIGTQVVKWNNRRHDRKGGKMEQLPWNYGPYYIHNITKSGSYKICSTPGGDPMKTAIPAKQLKKWNAKSSPSASGATSMTDTDATITPPLLILQQMLLILEVTPRTLHTILCNFDRICI